MIGVYYLKLYNGREESNGLLSPKEITITSQNIVNKGGHQKEETYLSLPNLALLMD